MRVFRISRLGHSSWRCSIIHCDNAYRSIQVVTQIKRSYLAMQERERDSYSSMSRPVTKHGVLRQPCADNQPTLSSRVMIISTAKWPGSLALLIRVEADLMHTVEKRKCSGREEVSMNLYTYTGAVSSATVRVPVKADSQTAVLFTKGQRNIYSKRQQNCPPARAALASGEFLLASLFISQRKGEFPAWGLSSFFFLQRRSTVGNSTY